jgi:hypothetical protein
METGLQVLFPNENSIPSPCPITHLPTNSYTVRSQKPRYTLELDEMGHLVENDLGQVGHRTSSTGIQFVQGFSLMYRDVANVWLKANSVISLSVLYFTLRERHLLVSLFRISRILQIVNSTLA